MLEEVWGSPATEAERERFRMVIATGPSRRASFREAAEKHLHFAMDCPMCGGTVAFDGAVYGDPPYRISDVRCSGCPQTYTVVRE